MYQLSVSCGDLRNNPPQQFMKLAFVLTCTYFCIKAIAMSILNMSAAPQFKPLIFV